MKQDTKENIEILELSAAPDDCVKGTDTHLEQDELIVLDEISSISILINAELRGELKDNTDLYEKTEFLPLINRVLSRCIRDTNLTKISINSYNLDIKQHNTMNKLRERVSGIKKPFNAVFRVSIELGVGFTETKTFELKYPIKIQRN